MDSTVTISTFGLMAISPTKLVQLSVILTVTTLFATRPHGEGSSRKGKPESQNIRKSWNSLFAKENLG